MEIDEMQIKMIEDLKNKGFNSKTTANKLQIPLSVVNDQYALLAKKEVIGKMGKRNESVTKMRIGHFEKLLEQKKEENSRLGEHRDYLVLNIRQLEKMCTYLQHKKAMLEKHISEMESYIKHGSEIADIFISEGIEQESGEDSELLTQSK